MTAFRLIAALLAALACVALIACGDDDDDATPTPTTSERKTPIDTGGEPSPDEKLTPTDEASPIATDEPGGDTPTPAPTASEGVPALQINDVAAFFAQFQTAAQDEGTCVYNPSARTIDCFARGLYAPAPPPTGQGADCFLMIADQNPVAVRCEVANPSSTYYYDIRQ